MSHADVKSVLIPVQDKPLAVTVHPDDEQVYLPTFTEPAAELLQPELPLTNQPSWLVALVVLAVLSHRLYQVLVAALLLLREFKQTPRPGQ